MIPVVLAFILLQAAAVVFSRSAGAATTWVDIITPSAMLGTARPNDPISFEVTVSKPARASGIATPETFSLVADPQGNFTSQHWLRMGALVKRDENVTHVRYRSSKQGIVPPLTGFHTLTFRATGNGTRMPDVSLTVEVSCSDGVLCNGFERLVAIPSKGKRKVQYRCARAPSYLCNDGNACTKDICLNGVCTFISSPSIPRRGKDNQQSVCRRCAQSNCQPICREMQRTCGWNGCFGTCGPDCKPGEICASGKCIQHRTEEHTGTCIQPISLNDAARAMDFTGKIVREVDYTKALDVLIPKCHIKKWFDPELVFRIDLPKHIGYVGLEVRPLSRTGLQGTTTVSIIEPNLEEPLEQGCLKSTLKPETVWACETSADSANSHVQWGLPATWMMRPGRTHYIAVERHEALPVFPRQPILIVQFTLTPECTTNCPAHAECGTSGCPGVLCGECPAGQRCVNYKCTACTPDCPANAHVVANPSYTNIL